MTRPARLRSLGAAAALAAALVGCGGDGGTSAEGCGPVQREALDPRSVHVLPNADDVVYETDPPTSGPHLPGPDREPVLDEPIPAPIQVGLLEEGAVLLQHSGLSEDERAELEELAGDGVVVAPARSLPDDAAVVATAWVTKQVCGALDVDALRSFAETYVDATEADHG